MTRTPRVLCCTTGDKHNQTVMEKKKPNLLAGRFLWWSCGDLHPGPRVDSLFRYERIRFQNIQTDLRETDKTDLSIPKQ